jgi:hypothetical protein
LKPNFKKKAVLQTAFFMATFKKKIDFVSQINVYCALTAELKVETIL